MCCRTPEMYAAHEELRQRAHLYPDMLAALKEINGKWLKHDIKGITQDGTRALARVTNIIAKCEKGE